jgi:hypothetical protein
VAERVLKSATGNTNVDCPAKEAINNNNNNNINNNNNNNTINSYDINSFLSLLDLFCLAILGTKTYFCTRLRSVTQKLGSPPLD